VIDTVAFDHSKDFFICSESTEELDIFNAAIATEKKYLPMSA
jgi:hypothetical protein